MTPGVSWVAPLISSQLSSQLSSLSQLSSQGLLLIESWDCIVGCSSASASAGVETGDGSLHQSSSDFRLHQRNINFPQDRRTGGQEDRRTGGLEAAVLQWLSQASIYSELCSPAKWSALIENTRAGREPASATSEFQTSSVECRVLPSVVKTRGYHIILGPHLDWSHSQWLRLIIFPSLDDDDDEI